jgi:hypothetical protein
MYTGGRWVSDTNHGACEARDKAMDFSGELYYSCAGLPFARDEASHDESGEGRDVLRGLPCGGATKEIAQTGTLFLCFTPYHRLGSRA